MHEMIKVKGHVRIVVTDLLTGKETIQEIDNLVVNGGKTILAKLLGHDAAYLSEYIGKMAWGSGSTAPAVTDVGLGSELFRKDVESVAYPAFNSVRFVGIILATEGGSSTYQEIGLFSAAGDKMFSRVLMNPVTKASTNQIYVEWTISFT